MRSRFSYTIVKGLMIMKKIIAIGVMICMIFSFSACSKNNITNNSSIKTTDLSKYTKNVDEGEYTVDTPIEIVINDKAFEDYGRLIFPT